MFNSRCSLWNNKCCSVTLWIGKCLTQCFVCFVVKCWETVIKNKYRSVSYNTSCNRKSLLLTTWKVLTLFKDNFIKAFTFVTDNFFWLRNFNSLFNIFCCSILSTESNIFFNSTTKHSGLLHYNRNIMV